MTTIDRTPAPAGTAPSPDAERPGATESTFRPARPGDDRFVDQARSIGAIAAEHAGEQGRNVLAVPGPVDAPLSGGTNALIRQGAILCRGIDDILEELQGISALGTSGKSSSSAAPPPAGPPPWLDETQRRVWDFLSGGPRHLDEMVQQLGIAVAQLSVMLLTMEMKKGVRRLPGNRYERS